MIKTFYELGELDGDVLILDDIYYEVCVGKHAIWIPDLPGKIVWTFNGKIDAFKDWDKGRNAGDIRDGVFNEDFFYDRDSIESIMSEYKLFRTLSKDCLCPVPNGFFFIKNFISREPFKGKHCDTKGKIGFFLENANVLNDVGLFSVEKFIESVKVSGIKIPSERTYGDLLKSDNIVNGYLIDVRRTIWDMMSIPVDSKAVDSFIDELIFTKSKEEIIKDIGELTQFPPKERGKGYQTYSLGNTKIEGARQTDYRWKMFNLPEDMRKMTVLDMGCNLGAFCKEAYLRGARKVTGIDNNVDYINVARSAAKYEGFDINYLVVDLKKEDDFINEMNLYYPDGIDVVFALSLYKHVEESLFRILNRISFKVCIIESNNAPKGIETDHVKNILKGMAYLNRKVTSLGQTEDRSPRLLWKIV